MVGRAGVRARGYAGAGVHVSARVAGARDARAGECARVGAHVARVRVALVCAREREHWRRAPDHVAGRVMRTCHVYT